VCERDSGTCPFRFGQPLFPANGGRQKLLSRKFLDGGSLRMKLRRKGRLCRRR
jgi:hypothetical protein